MKLTPSIAERIRVNYASGLYHKADIALNFLVYLNSPKDISGILNYTVMPEVRKDLKGTIVAVEKLLKANNDYQLEVCTLAVEDYTKSLTGEVSEVIFTTDKKKSESKLKGIIKEINKEYKTTFNFFDVTSRFYREF